jgi:hypothetical protein
MPVAVEEARERAVLRHVQHERIAVDVVAHVAVVEPRHRGALELGPLPALVPIDGQHVPVGIERWEQDQHDLAEHPSRLGVARGRQVVEELVGRLCRTDLRRVDARADGDDDRLGVGELERLLLRDRSRIRQLLVRGLDGVEPYQILRSGDDRADEPIAVGRRAGVNQLHAIGRGGHRLEVLLNLGPRGQLPIGAHAETKEGLGRGHRRGRLNRDRLRPREARRCHEGDQQEEERAHGWNDTGRLGRVAQWLFCVRPDSF